jgi:phospholipid transport system substrate-binding protein
LRAEQEFVMSRRFAMPFTAFVLLVGISGSVAAADGATDFIRQMGDRAVATVNDQGLSDAARAKRFGSIFREAFAVPVIGRFVLGQYWRRTSDTERKEYLQVFSDYVVQTYSERFSGAVGVKFTVGQPKPVGEGETLVPTQIIRPGAQPIEVQWRVKHMPAGYKIVDVIFGGVSMLISEREQFAAIINQNGGKVAGLIQALKQKTGKG